MEGLPAFGCVGEEVRERMSDYGKWVRRVVNERLVMEVSGGVVIWLPYLPLPLLNSLRQS